MLARKQDRASHATLPCVEQRQRNGGASVAVPAVLAGCEDATDLPHVGQTRVEVSRGAGHATVDEQPRLALGKRTFEPGAALGVELVVLGPTEGFELVRFAPGDDEVGVARLERAQLRFAFRCERGQLQALEARA